MAVRLQETTSPDRTRGWSCAPCPFSIATNRRAHPPHYLPPDPSAPLSLGLISHRPDGGRPESLRIPGLPGRDRAWCAASWWPLHGRAVRRGMSGYRLPVDLVWGEKDAEVPLEVAVRAQAAFPGLRSPYLPGSDIWSPPGAPDQTLAAILGSGWTMPQNRHPGGELWGDPHHHRTGPIRFPHRRGLDHAWGCVWRPACLPGSAGYGWLSESTTWPARLPVSPAGGGGRRWSTGRLARCCGCRPRVVVVAGRALVTAAVVAVGPLGLSCGARTSPLAWTRRLRTLAAGVGRASRPSRSWRV